MNLLYIVDAKKTWRHRKTMSYNNRWRSSYQGRGGWDTINRFHPAIFLCMSQTRTWITNVIFHGLFCVQRVEMGGDCSFCLQFRAKIRRAILLTKYNENDTTIHENLSQREKYFLQYMQSFEILKM